MIVKVKYQRMVDKSVGSLFSSVDSLFSLCETSKDGGGEVGGESGGDRGGGVCSPARRFSSMEVPDVAVITGCEW